MMAASKRPNNKILASLPAADRTAVSLKLVEVPLVYGEQIHQANEPIQHLFFPESGIVSLISRADDTSFIEVGMLGNEGVAGFPVALGVKTSASVAVVQGAGIANKILAKDFLKLCESTKALRQAVLRSVHGLMTQTALAAPCNAYHLIDRRLARWLLMSHDRMQADEFDITQDFLSHMLAVRREAVNRAIAQIRRLGFIEFGRAKLKITDRAGLEGLACSCYGKIMAAYRSDRAI